ncbi:hypothetical protein [Pseudomonas orientalis]|uniref:hypothetical protein n=1 Tax=Pseudomonas orientalis TaxID=76758 RepID=UPI0015E730C5|nr:hypothetical protein [Pseudomonas orientalis]
MESLTQPLVLEFTSVPKLQELIVGPLSQSPVLFYFPMQASIDGECWQDPTKQILPEQGTSISVTALGRKLPHFVSCDPAIKSKSPRRRTCVQQLGE